LGADPQLVEKVTDGTPVDFGLGTKVTLIAAFDPDLAVNWGDTGYQFVSFYRNGPDPGELYSLGMNGDVWTPIEEILDGMPVYTSEKLMEFSSESKHYGSPAVLIKDGKVAGLTGNIFHLRGNSPIFYMNNHVSGYEYCFLGACESAFSPLNLTDRFDIAQQSLYGNSYTGPSFIGKWDFTGSYVGVPEPSTWVLMVLGVGFIGSALRRPSRKCRV
jgi:hypothetical protein